MIRWYLEHLSSIIVKNIVAPRNKINDRIKDMHICSCLAISLKKNIGFFPSYVFRQQIKVSCCRNTLFVDMRDKRIKN